MCLHVFNQVLYVHVKLWMMPNAWDWRDASLVIGTCALPQWFYAQQLHGWSQSSVTLVSQDPLPSLLFTQSCMPVVCIYMYRFDKHTRKKVMPGMLWYTLKINYLESKRQVNFHEFNALLVYIVSSMLFRSTQWVSVSQSIN